MELGALATVVSAIGGLVLGAIALWRQFRSDTKVEDAQEKAGRAEERTLALAELEAALEAQGKLIALAVARADACEAREIESARRLAASEARLAQTEHRIAELERERG